MPTLTPDLRLRGHDMVTVQHSPVFPLDVNGTVRHLKALEDAEALELLPVMIVLGMMSLVGNLGNGVAMYVYYTRFTPSSTRTYIIAMSVCDLLFCSISLPGEILDIRFPLTYTAHWLCRLYRFITVCLTILSALILVTVALDRRRKICFPFRTQLTPRQVSLSVVGCIVAAVVMGFPFGILNGHHSVKTELEGVVGSACSVDDAFIDTSFPTIYNGCLLLIFLVCAVAMSVSYVQIARKIIAQKRKSTTGDGTTARGLALLMGKHSPADTTDTLRSSSHFDDGTSDFDNKHQQQANISQIPSHSAEEFKLTDDVLAAETGPKPLVPEPETNFTTTKTTSADSNTKKPVRSKNTQRTLKSGSMKRRDEEFEMAVKTLVHAVSEEMLHSSELFRKRIVNHSVSRTRSASVSEMSSSPSRQTIPETTPTIHPTATSQNNNNVRTNTDVNNMLISPENDANKTRKHPKNGDEMESGGKEKTCSENTEMGTKRMERNASFKSSEDNPTTETESTTSPRRNGDTKNKEIQRNASIKSADESNNETKGDSNNTRHVTISETRSERFQSIVHNTLTRIKSQNRSTGNDVTTTTSLRRRHWGKGIPSRTTWMMFVLTAIFVISYLPYLTLAGVRAAHHGIETGLQGWKLNLYMLALKSYFINSIINPVVYSFCSVRFRHQCRHLFRRRAKMSISD